eukprot:6214372-Pleurochrysis_carterae.AAC.4
MQADGGVDLFLHRQDRLDVHCARLVIDHSSDGDGGGVRRLSAASPAVLHRRQACKLNRCVDRLDGASFTCVSRRKRQGFQPNSAFQGKARLKEVKGQ